VGLCPILEPVGLFTERQAAQRESKRTVALPTGTETSNPASSSNEPAANSEIGSTQEIVRRVDRQDCPAAAFSRIMLGAGGKGLTGVGPHETWIVGEP